MCCWKLKRIPELNVFSTCETREKNVSGTVHCCCVDQAEDFLLKLLKGFNEGKAAASLTLFRF